MNTTLTMDDYIKGMRVAGIIRDFDAWIQSEGIDKMLCTEITFGEGRCRLRCYEEPRTKELRQIERVVIPSSPPPATVMQYLLTR